MAKDARELEEGEEVLSHILRRPVDWIDGDSVILNENLIRVRVQEGCGFDGEGGSLCGEPGGLV